MLVNDLMSKFKTLISLNHNPYLVPSRNIPDDSNNVSESFDSFFDQTMHITLWIALFEQTMHLALC